MRPPRRPRTLTSAEARLWGEIAKLITPLRGRAVPSPGSSLTADAPGADAPLADGRHGSTAEHARPPARDGQQAARNAAAKPAFRQGAGGRAQKLGDLAPPSAAPSRPHIATLRPSPPPGLERRERIGLSRGTLPIEARIDLHGLRQADAHDALVGFLRRARQAGHARVLVVTGKGSDEPFSERGVLRRAVPHWLRGGELRALVLGFEEAARHHGGAGALYVRLRRR